MRLELSEGNCNYWNTNIPAHKKVTDVRLKSYWLYSRKFLRLMLPTPRPFGRFINLSNLVLSAEVTKTIVLNIYISHFKVKCSGK